eukprot:scaffold478_cov409-Prasinococcus_capsulatus_cf.AAC.24
MYAAGPALRRWRRCELHPRPSPGALVPPEEHSSHHPPAGHVKLGWPTAPSSHAEPYTPAGGCASLASLGHNLSGCR